ncbi:hypothetical protein JYQ62_27930 [Nostoc sp. UHCC 0702]|nr:hypothetical protein JYQ62_27930 [Nostoc sp. UHCC 0702]
MVYFRRLWANSIAGDRFSTLAKFFPKKLATHLQYSISKPVINVVIHLLSPN